MKNNYTLKQIAALVCLVLCSAGMYAQVKCATIAEVKKQKAKTEILYTGEATTTFFSYGGIIIQDSTDAIHLKSFDMSEWGTLKAGPNMVITNILGTYNPSDEMQMAEIKIDFPDDARKIKFLQKSGAEFSIRDISLGDLIKGRDTLECKPIRIKGLTVRFEGFRYFAISGSDTLPIGALNGIQLPAKGDFIGYYGDDQNMKGFVVPTDTAITPLGYNNIGELQQLFIELNDPIELLDNALVSRVTRNDSTTTLYIQQKNNFEQECGLAYIVRSTTLNVAAGDSVSGIRGVYRQLTTDDAKNQAYGSTLTDTTDGSAIRIINRKNKITPTEISDLSFLKSAGIINYESQLVVSPVGKVLQKEVNGVKQYCLESSNMYETNYVIIKGTDFSKYLGKEIAVVGIVDAGITEPGVIALYLRNDYDILKSSYDFENLAKMKEVGVSLAKQVTYTLNSELLVTFVKSWMQEETKIYGFYAQDSTGGIYIQSEADLNIVAGDSIRGISGIYFEQTVGAPYMYLDSTATTQKLSSGNIFDQNLEEVYMKDLAENRAKYAGTVVKLIGVQHGEGNMGSSESGLITGKFLYQGEYRMPYSQWNYTLFDVSDIVGIFDDGGFAENFSFMPLSQEHITKSEYVPEPDPDDPNKPDPDPEEKPDPEDTAVENTDADCYVILSEYGEILAPNAEHISVYSIQGHKLAERSGESLSMSQFQRGIYVILTTYGDNTVRATKVSL